MNKHTPTLNSSSAIDILSRSTSVDEVTECLNGLAIQANQSVSAALKAQVQVIKYISSPDLCGSAFDLFFKNLKNVLTHCEDEENAYEIREKAGLMLNNFIFFTKAKIEWELLVNRKAGEQLFIHASNELAKSVCEIALLPAGANTVVVSTAAIKNISKILFDPDEQGDNLFKKAGRLIFKRSRTAEKQANFIKTLDKLANKLCKHCDIIGKNNLIAGIFDNYYEDLMEYHSDEWLTHEVDADEQLDKSWQVPTYILVIGGILSGLVWLVRWVYSWFGDLSDGWAQLQWMWTGIGVGGIAVIVSLIFLCRYMIFKYISNKKFKAYRNYYQGIIDYFSE